MMNDLLLVTKVENPVLVPLDLGAGFDTDDHSLLLSGPVHQCHCFRLLSIRRTELYLMQLKSSGQLCGFLHGSILGSAIFPIYTPRLL